MKLLLVVVMGLWIQSAYAVGKTKCTQNNLVREVEVSFAGNEDGPACQVKYYKPSEGTVKPLVLWSASKDASYCEPKAANFIKKLKSWGWECTSGTPQTQESGKTEETKITQ